MQTHLPAKLILVIIVGTLFCSCIREFNPPVSEDAGTYLVVDGNITIGDTTTFRLSRTSKLLDSIPALPELNAQVQIESANGGQILLQPHPDGRYSSLGPSSVGQYRMRITTANGNVYLSDFVEAKTSPAIDSVEWVHNNDILIYVNTHDDKALSRYYRWEFEETSEYRAVYDSNIEFRNGTLVFISPAEMRTVCYNYYRSNQILIFSTAGLGADVVSKFLLTTLPNDNSKISQRYSILVKQQVLTPEAFEYWRIVRQNSEQSGNIFDPQPSQLYGNIHRADNSAEPVIGYVSASTVSQKRIFIRQSQLDSIVYPNTDFCKEDFIDPQFAGEHLSDGALLPAYYRMSDGFLAIAPAECVDCRLSGGTTLKPPYW
jgi:hypothetical protein